MKIKSTTDRVIELHDKPWRLSMQERWVKLVAYAKFVKTPLELGMFVPVDKDGNYLHEPKISDYTKDGEYSSAWEAWEAARENVLFEGLVLCDSGNKDCVMMGDVHIPFTKINQGTIEDLIPYNLTITQNAIKKYGL